MTVAQDADKGVPPKRARITGNMQNGGQGGSSSTLGNLSAPPNSVGRGVNMHVVTEIWKRKMIMGKIKKETRRISLRRKVRILVMSYLLTLLLLKIEKIKWREWSHQKLCHMKRLW